MVDNQSVELDVEALDDPSVVYGQLFNFSQRVQQRVRQLRDNEKEFEIFKLAWIDEIIRHFT